VVRLDGRLRRRRAGRSLYQMVEREAAAPGAEISAPSQHRDNAKAHGRTRRLLQLHLFGAVGGAGGYQMFRPSRLMPIYDPNQKISYLRDFMCLFRPGDIVKWKPIDRPAYDAAVADVDAGPLRTVIRDVSSPAEPNSTTTSMPIIASSRGCSHAH